MISRVPVAARRPLAGFSLVELLVVIAVVALLVSLLLPTLRWSREQARAAICVSNVRQLTAAATMYATEHRNEWPVMPSQTYPGGSLAWCSWNYGGNDPSEFWKNNYGGALYWKADQRPLNPYLYDEIVMSRTAGSGPSPNNGPVSMTGIKKFDMAVFRCPSDPGTYQRAYWSNTEWDGGPVLDRSITSYEDVGTSYHQNLRWWIELWNLNSAGKLPGGPYSPADLWYRYRNMFRQASLNLGSRFIWVHDQNMDLVAIRGMSRNGDHGRLNRATVAFMDGRAAYMEITPGAVTMPEYTMIFKP
ncbi:MAG: DUF1559 domain-containing protein [Phycisphaerales bacterium]|nr:DUF1559 domain-containing protein [Phycisphaerales bacterium]